MNVETKLSKILGRAEGTFVVKASDRDTVLSEISARAARYKKLDPDTYNELMLLRKNVKDIFDKGLNPGQDILEQLYFLDAKTKDFVDKLSGSYARVITPNDFKKIANIMSDHLAIQVPILKDFTKFFGRLAQDFLENAKPSTAAFDWKSVAKGKILGDKKRGYVLPDRVSEILGIKSGEAVSEKFLKALGTPRSLHELIYGADTPAHRRTGAKFLGFDVPMFWPSWKRKALGKDVTLIPDIEILKANKLPKSWTNVPWANFDGKIIEQNFTQQFEERLKYKDKDGNWITNMVQVPQKTEASWWEQAINKDGKINDIADVTKARTAFAVNGNHSSDAVIVKRFHIWGAENGVATSTIHDAFFTNIGDMLEAKRALKQAYANALDKNSIKITLDEMRKRGLPKELYDKYLAEAIEIGLIPVVGKSRVNGRLLTDADILSREDILEQIDEKFDNRRGWYGIGP